MDGRTDRQTYGWVDGCMDGWLAHGCGWMDGPGVLGLPAWSLSPSSLIPLQVALESMPATHQQGDLLPKFGRQGSIGSPHFDYS